MTTAQTGNSLSESMEASEFGTMGSYRTARDWNEAETGEGPGSEGTLRGVVVGKSTRPALNDIWGGEEGDESVSRAPVSAMPCTKIKLMRSQPSKDDLGPRRGSVV